MSNQLSELLNHWLNAKDDTDWVLGTVYKTEKSSYRKAGAIMLINGYGQQFGLLSGGCLEADIIRNARKVMVTGKPTTLVYDGSDEDDLSYRLGVGCGGKVYIMLQQVSAQNDLGLTAMAEALNNRARGLYYQKIGENEAFFEQHTHLYQNISWIENGWLVTPVQPEPHLLIVGGGMDARPVVSIAKELGWYVSVNDSRAANARKEDFIKSDMLLREPASDLKPYIRNRKVDVVILMSHNIDMDAAGLKAAQHTDVKHIALLGPHHRFEQVLERAGLQEQDLTCPVSGPAGLDIGAQLPESIALSILAECHQKLHAGKMAYCVQEAAE